MIQKKNNQSRNNFNGQTFSHFVISTILLLKIICDFIYLICHNLLRKKMNLNKIITKTQINVKTMKISTYTSILECSYLIKNVTKVSSLLIDCLSL